MLIMCSHPSSQHGEEEENISSLVNVKTNCDGNKPYCVYTHNTECEKEIAYLRNDKKAAAADVPTTHKICLPYHTHCLTLRDYISLRVLLFP